MSSPSVPVSDMNVPDLFKATKEGVSFIKNSLQCFLKSHAPPVKQERLLNESL